MKLLFIPLTLICSILSFGQDAKQYFFPASKNKASFYCPDSIGNRTLITSVIYYLRKGERYELLAASFFKGNPGKIETQVVQFTPTEVRLVKTITTNVYETNNEATYNPPKVLLRIPDEGSFTASWDYMDPSGEKTLFLSSWATVKINSKELDAIKVTETYIMPDGKVFGAKLISYYVLGIGLWRTEGEVNGKPQPIDIQESLVFDQTASTVKF